MKKLINDKNLNEFYYVQSRATHTDEIWGGHGSDIYPPAQREMQLHGIPFTHREATLLTKEDGIQYDIILGMDSENMRYIPKIIGSNSKTYNLMEFTSKGGNVSDPWYTRDFTKAYNDIYEGCIGLLDYLERKRNDD